MCLALAGYTYAYMPRVLKPGRALDLARPSPLFPVMDFGQRHSTVENFRRKVGLSGMEKSTSEGFVSFNPVPAAAWVALVSIAAWKTVTNPSSAALDTMMLQQIIEDPINPGINELFYGIFNLFAVAPVIVACLVLPQGRKEGIPAGPFLVASSFIGYFSLGVYLSLRKPPRDSVARSDLSWPTANIFENKFLALAIAIFTAYLPFAVGLPTSLNENATSVVQGYVDLLRTSNFALVSSVDLCMIHAACVGLTVRDYCLRSKRDAETTERNAKLIAAATFFLPFLGSATYLALRPPLHDEGR